MTNGFVLGAAGRSVLDPAGPAARELAALGWPIMIFFTLVTVVMWALLAWVAVRRRGTLDRHERVNAGGGEGWILIGGFLVPAIAFAVVFFMTLHSMSAFPMAHEARSAPPDIRVTGRQWWWEVEYLMEEAGGTVVTANEIHLPVGRPLDIELLSDDVIHSFWVPRLHGKVDMLPGRVNRITLEADTPGVYRGSCAEFCGVQHTHMQLRIVAREPGEFRRWLAAQAQPATEPHGAQARLGRAVFMEGPCLVCHTVRGTPARGTVGPDLTHFASRRTLGAGTRPNTAGALHAWVADAQAIKPGVAMPRMRGLLSEDQLRQLVAYLQGLD